MEARLRARLAAPPDRSAVEASSEGIAVPADEASEAVSAVDNHLVVAAAENNGHIPLLPGMESESVNAWNDDAAESAFRAEARERGETVATSRPATEIEDERAGKALPPLEDLVNRLSPEVREALEDLFRAKFTAVRRLPKSSLKV